MGYSHYWYQKRDFSKKEWDAFKEDLEHLKSVLPPTIGAFENCFGTHASGNGLDADVQLAVIIESLDSRVHIEGAEPFDFETGAFQRRVQKRTWETEDEFAKKGMFNSCKTARMPYDAFLCAALLVAKEKLGEDLIVNSDGGPEEWASAARMARYAFPQRKIGLELVFSVDDWSKEEWETFTKKTAFETAVEDEKALSELTRSGPTIRKTGL